MNPRPSFPAARQTIIYVIATLDGTEAALQKASSLALRDGATLVLLVPQIANPTESLEVRARKRQWWLAACERQVQRVHPPAEILTCAGETLDDAIERFAPRGATVVIGGPRRAWWPSPEQRLSGRLRRKGYDPVFVSTSPPGRFERFMWRRVLAAHGAHLFGDDMNPRRR